MGHLRLVACLLAAQLGICGAASAAVDDDYQPSNETPRPMLGVEMSPTTTSTQEREGLGPHEGVQVQSVFDGTAAKQMGVQPGDVITSVNGVPITSMTDLRNEVGSSAVGDGVGVVVRRNGQDVQLGARLQPWPTSIPYEPIDPAAEQRFRDWQARRLERQAQEVQDIQRQVADLERRMNQPREQAQAAPRRQDPAAAAAAFDREVDEMAGVLAGLPSWKVDYRIGLDRSRPLPDAVGEITAAEPLVKAAPEAWRFSWAIASKPDPQAATGQLR